MQAERVRLDRSSSSVVAVCSCGWRTVYADAAQAARTAHRHLSAAHGAGERGYDLLKRNVRGAR